MVACQIEETREDLHNCGSRQVGALCLFPRSVLFAVSVMSNLFWRGWIYYRAEEDDLDQESSRRPGELTQDSIDEP